MDKKSYNRENERDKDRAMKTQEMLEARLFDAMESALSAEEHSQLMTDLGSHPELLAIYHEMINSMAKDDLYNTVPKSVFAKVNKTAIDTRFEQNLIEKMDDEAIWLATIPQVKGIIYKFMMPVMAASLLLFFQFSEPSATTQVSGFESQLLDDLTGYEDLTSFQDNLQEYAGLSVLDAIIAELNQPTSTITTPNK